MPAKKGKGVGKKPKQEEEDNLRKQKMPEVMSRFQSLFEIYSVAEKDDSQEVISEEDFPIFVRSLGLCVTNEKVQELAQQCLREGEDGSCFYQDKLQEVLAPLVVEALLNPTSEYAPPSEEKILEALRALDSEHKGHLTEGDFRTFLSDNGEKFDADELDSAADEAVNPTTGVVDLERYAGRLLYNSKVF